MILKFVSIYNRRLFLDFEFSLFPVETAVLEILSKIEPLARIKMYIELQNFCRILN